MSGRVGSEDCDFDGDIFNGGTCEEEEEANSDPGGGGGGFGDPNNSFGFPTPTPLVIDLDGDGVELMSLQDSTTQFDLNVDGFAERTGWIAPDDGFLAYDRNGNGFIDDNTELDTRINPLI